jgi:hypothetical protein
VGCEESVSQSFSGASSKYSIKHAWQPFRISPLAFQGVDCP